MRVGREGHASREGGGSESYLVVGRNEHAGARAEANVAGLGGRLGHAPVRVYVGEGHFLRLLGSRDGLVVIVVGSGRCGDVSWFEFDSVLCRFGRASWKLPDDGGVAITIARGAASEVDGPLELRWTCVQGFGALYCAL